MGSLLLERVVDCVKETKAKLVTFAIARFGGQKRAAFLDKSLPSHYTRVGRLSKDESGRRYEIIFCFVLFRKWKVKDPRTACEKCVKGDESDKRLVCTWPADKCGRVPLSRSQPTRRFRKPNNTLRLLACYR